MAKRCKKNWNGTRKKIIMPYDCDFECVRRLMQINNTGNI